MKNLKRFNRHESMSKEVFDQIGIILRDDLRRNEISREQRYSVETPHFLWWQINYQNLFVQKLEICGFFVTNTQNLKLKHIRIVFYILDSGENSHLPVNS